MLSKVLQVFPDYITQPDKADWAVAVAHLLFPHAWVRTASCRLIGLLFSSVPIAAPSETTSLPLTTAGMTDIATKLCLQLKSEHLDETLSLQVVKNLFYIGKSFNAIPTCTSEDATAEDTLVEGETIEDSSEFKKQDPLPWLFSRLSYQARSAHIARRNRTSVNSGWGHQPIAVFRWFAAMASHMEPQRLEKFLVHILTPLYRVVEDDTIHDPQMGGYFIAMSICDEFQLTRIYR